MTSNTIYCHIHPDRERDNIAISPGNPQKDRNLEILFPQARLRVTSMYPNWCRWKIFRKFLKKKKKLRCPSASIVEKNPVKTAFSMGI